jgi:tetratricopeptide (TPR) repeat protein
MKRYASLWLGLLAVSLVPAFAQTPAPAANMGKIHGHVINPTGAPQSVGAMSLSNDGGHTSKYTFPVNANGDFSGDAAAGTYMLVFRQPDTPADKMVDSIDNVKILAGQDILQDDDMSRKEFIDKLPAEEQKQLKELREHNATALKANEIIKNLNSDLKVVVQDIHDADTAKATAAQTLGAGASKAALDAKELEIKTAKYTEVETLMTKDSQAKPDASILWAQLGQAENGLKKYDDAVTDFQKALDLENVAKKPNPEIQGLANSGLGEAYARASKIQQASDAYDAAAKINPTRAGFYLKNEAVIFFQTNQPDAQIAAADKAIAADPTNPIPYYLKGNGLIGKTTEDPKTHKLVPPAGCIEAYQKYLDLAPTGPYSADVKSILAGFNQSIDTSYKADKKKK